MKYIKLDDAIRAAESCTDSMEPISHDIVVKLVVDRLKGQLTTEIVRCRDCMYSPSGTDDADNTGFGLEWPHDDWPEDNPCPCKCEDGWYSHKPKPDFFWFCSLLLLIPRSFFL